MTDVEGHWSYFCNFVELSEGLTFAEDGDQRDARRPPELILKDGWHFVFGGDTCDKGPGSLRCLETLVSAKKRYPDRVHLLLGNRDINKMRYTSEFTDEEVRKISSDTPGAYWVPEDKRVSPWSYFTSLAAHAEGKDTDHLTHEEIRHFCTKSNLMRYHLKYDMGSDGEFEFRRQELAHMSERNVAEVSDEEVVKSYEDSVAEDGVMRDYLRLGEIACILGSTLFVHGQIIGNQFYDCGHDGVAWAVGCVPSEDGATFEWVADLRDWVKQVNTWARRSVGAWQVQPTWQRSPSAPTFEEWSHRGGAGLIAYGTPATRVPSVVYCRWLEGNCMPKSPWLIATSTWMYPCMLPVALARPADVKCAAPQRVLGSFAIMSEQSAEDRQIEQWKVKRLVRMLDAARGNGTSAITLILNSKQDINLTNKMLTEEYGTASCIKSRVNRLSVLSAITSTQQRLKKYNRTPPNGLIVFCGEVLTEDNKEKKLTIDFEPFKPINTSMYLCDSKFHTEPLAELMEDDDKFGFLIMDGNGSLFGTVQGNHREILHKFTVDLPKKHGRGGQSALRFARLRLEKRHNYVRKVGETATQMFIPNGETPNIKGLIVAGSAEFKQDLTTNTDLFDQRLAAIVIPPLLDISYGGEAGFNQAIELSAETLRNVKFVQEKKLVTKFLDEVATDSGRYCFGIKDTMQGLEAGAVEILIIWEQLDIKRLVIRNPHTDTEEVKYVTPEQEKDPKLYVDKETNVELNVTENEAFLDWIVVNYKNYGTKLEFISDRSQEGNQFVKGFGGIGGLMRYQLEFDMLEEPDLAEADSDDDFM
ncbi:ERF1 [Symbiodinium sp. CCMP2592]|nr:ERF1 [Symbiodinium sp. CCMP2592]